MRLLPVFVIHLTCTTEALKAVSPGCYQKGIHPLARSGAVWGIEFRRFSVEKAAYASSELLQVESNQSYTVGRTMPVLFLTEQNNTACSIKSVSCLQNTGSRLAASARRVFCITCSTQSCAF